MASNGSLASYFISLGIKVDKSELKKIDTLLKDIEKRLKGIGKAQEETNKPRGKRPLSEEQQRLKIAKEAAKVAEHQLSLRQKWLKQQDQIAQSAKKVHDFQMKLMNKGRAAEEAIIKRKLAQQAALLSGKKPGTPLKEGNEFDALRKRLEAARKQLRENTQKQSAANRRAFFDSARRTEIKTGQGSQYRRGEQRAGVNGADAAKKEAERLAAEKAANKKIEEERKKHAARLARIEEAKLRHQRTMDRIYGRAQAQQRLQEQAHQNWLARQRLLQEQRAARGGSRSGASYSRANFLHAGGAAGAFMRYGAGALPFIGGAYGMMALNKANQNLVSSNIAAESVLGGRSKEMLDWLASKTNYIGASYADTLPQFTKFMASAQPLMGADASKDIFASFLQFGRTRGADRVSMNRALTAVAQIKI